MPATNTRQLTANQTEYLRMVLDLIRANGGSTRLTRSPDALIRRGLIARAARGLPGAHGCGARYTLTTAGMELANMAEQARIERAAIRRSLRGDNAVISA